MLSKLFVSYYFMVRNKKHVDNDLLINFVYLSKSRENSFLAIFATLSKDMEKLIFDPTLLQWRKVCKTTILTIFAILSKIENKVVFEQICYPEQNSGKRQFWSYLPHWAKVREKWYLTNFATMRKSMENYYSDHICHLGKIEDKVVFGQNCYTGQNINKMIFCSDLLPWAKLLKNEFWSHLLQWAKMCEIIPLIEFATESKRIQKFVFDRFCPFEQKPDKFQFQHQVCYPCKCLEKVKVILVFTHAANLRQIRHLPPLPSMQNYGKFDTTPFGKIEQNWANVAFADGLLQIFYTGKSVFSSSEKKLLNTWASIS